MEKAIRKKTAERRRYTAEYRREALLLADKVGVAEAAKQLGLHESQLYSWRGKDRLERSQSDVEKQQALGIVKLKRQLAEKTEDLTILKNSPPLLVVRASRNSAALVYTLSLKAAPLDAAKWLFAQHLSHQRRPSSISLREIRTKPTT